VKQDEVGNGRPAKIGPGASGIDPGGTGNRTPAAGRGGGPADQGGSWTRRDGGRTRSGRCSRAARPWIGAGDGAADGGLLSNEPDASQFGARSGSILSLIWHDFDPHLDRFESETKFAEGRGAATGMIVGGQETSTELLLAGL
jgi:hypothetical protein